MYDWESDVEYMADAGMKFSPPDIAENELAVDAVGRLIWCGKNPRTGVPGIDICAGGVSKDDMFDDGALCSEKVLADFRRSICAESLRANFARNSD